MSRCALEHLCRAPFHFFFMLRGITAAHLECLQLRGFASESFTIFRGKRLSVHSGIIVPRHKFTLGQPVFFADFRFPNLISGAECVVVQLLPTCYLGPEYLIRCPRVAGLEMIVGELELTAAEPSEVEGSSRSEARLAA